MFIQCRAGHNTAMAVLDTAAALISLAALFSWVNHRFIRLPATIALLLFSLAVSLGVIGLGRLGIHFDTLAVELLREVDFDQALLHGMLSFLLFAGALHVDLDDLFARRGAIGYLATAGVLVSTALIGLATWWLFAALGHPLPLVWCLLFGALISPTDPIAVLAILKSAGAEHSLRVKMAGESLLNDGVGVVVFLALLGLVAGGEHATPAGTALLFAREALGGAAFGLAIGWVAYQMLASVDHYQVEVLVTLALVMGGYALASALHLSGPIAIVVAGVMIGNHGRRFAMSERTIEHLDTFWELIDEILNAVLFVLIGLEVLLITFDPAWGWTAALAIPLVLGARFLAISVGALLPWLRHEFPPRVVGLLTWGGLRGGISIALALSLPAGSEREALITVTYVVVVFSILVQGLTLARLLRRVSSS
jgi:CPA1 family monovalent cation:H+ antiporter